MNVKSIKLETLLIIVLLIVPILKGCKFQSTQNKKSPTIEQVIIEVKKIELESIMNYDVCFRGMDDDSKVIMFYKHNDADKNIAFLRIDESCRISNIDYSHWSYSPINSKNLEIIKKCMCCFDLDLLHVDSCKNIHFRAAFTDDKTYVIMRDSSCFDNRYNYTLFKNECYVKSKASGATSK